MQIFINTFSIIEIFLNIFSHHLQNDYTFYCHFRFSLSPLYQSASQILIQSINNLSFADVFECLFYDLFIRFYAGGGGGAFHTELRLRLWLI